jgi:hypothetical protein
MTETDSSLQHIFFLIELEVWIMSKKFAAVITRHKPSDLIYCQFLGYIVWYWVENYRKGL